MTKEVCFCRVKPSIPGDKPLWRAVSRRRQCRLTLMEHGVAVKPFTVSALPRFKLNKQYWPKYCLLLTVPACAGLETCLFKPACNDNVCPCKFLRFAINPNLYFQYQALISHAMNSLILENNSRFTKTNSFPLIWCTTVFCPLEYWSHCTCKVFFHDLLHKVMPGQ